MRKNTVWIARVLAFMLFFQTVPSVPVFQTIALAQEVVASVSGQTDLPEEPDAGEQTDLQQNLSSQETNVVDETAVLTSEDALATVSDEQAVAEALSERFSTQAEELAYNKLMTLLETGVIYSKLSNADKSLLQQYYNITDDAMQVCEEAGLSAQEALPPAMIISRLNVSLEQANGMISNYKQLEGDERGEQRAILQAESYVEFMEAYPSIDQEGRTKLLGLVLDGYKASSAVYTYIASKAMDANINDIIWTKKNDGQAVVDLSAFSVEDAENLTGIAGLYSVRLDFLLSYMTKHGLTVEQLSIRLKNCQLELDIFVFHNEAEPINAIQSFSVEEDTPKDHPIAPFSYAYGENERINLNNGELNYYDPIVSLAGKNGLDLNITLVYNSSDATLDKIERVLREPSGGSYMAKGKVSIFTADNRLVPLGTIPNLYVGKAPIAEDKAEDKKTFDEIMADSYAKYPAFQVDYTDIYYSITDNKEWVKSFSSESSAKGFIRDDLDDTMYQMPKSYGVDTDTFKSRYYMAGWKYWKSHSGKSYNYEYYFDMEAFKLENWQYRETNIVEKEGGNPFIDMGIGWGLNFSRVILAPKENRKYIQLDTGEKHELVFENNAYKLVDTLKDYPLKDLAFADAIAEDKTKVPGSRYVLTYLGRDKAGQKEYFDENGFLLAIIDRFGNTISFALSDSPGLTDMKDLTIKDTIGRDITIKYKDYGAKVGIEVRLPDNSVISYMGDCIYDNAKGLDNLPYRYVDPHKDEDDESKYAEYTNPNFLLRTKTDALGNETRFQYNTEYPYIIDGGEAHKYLYFCSKPEDYPRVGSDGQFIDKANLDRTSVFNLTRVFYPTGAVSKYDYKVIAAPLSYGSRLIYAVTDHKYDVSSSSVFEEEYEYCIEDSDNYKTAVTSALTDVITEHTFNDQGYRIETLVRYGSTKYVSTKYSFQQDRYNLPKEISTTWYNSNNQNNQLLTKEQFLYDDVGNIEVYTDATGVKTTYTYDNKYNMLTEKTSRNKAVKEVYTLTPNKDQVQSIKITGSDINGNDQNKGETSYIYNLDYTLKEQEITLGTSPTSSITTSYKYDINGLYVAEQTTSGVTEKFTYDTMGRVLTVVDGKGQKTSFTYDKLGRQLTQTNPDNKTQTMEYTANKTKNTLRITDEKGHVIEYRYDGLGYLTSIWDMTGSLRLKLLAYNRDRQLVSETDANSIITSYTYDKLGRVSTKQVKQGTTLLYSESYDYQDAFEGTYNKVTKTVFGDTSSPSIITTSYTNNKGQLVKEGIMSDNTERFTTYTYDGLGDLESVKSAKDAAAAGNIPYTNQYMYDYAGRVIIATNSNGEQYSTTYDMLGRKLSVTDPKGNTTLYTYDAFGRVTEEKRPFEGSNNAVIHAVTTYAYDANGNLTNQTALTNKPGEGATTSTTEYEYNNRNFLTKTTIYGESGDSSYVTYTYDNVGNMITMTTGNGASTTSYKYDNLNRLEEMTDPLGQNESCTYDNNGNLKTKKDRNGVTTTNTYNGLNLLTQVSTSGGDSMTYAYTATGAKGTESNKNVTTIYQYNDRGLLIKQTETSDGLTVVKDYTYDLAGNRISFKLTKNGTLELSVSYEYNNLNQLITVKENGQLVAEYDYDENGNRTSLTYSNGVTTSYAYNNANLVTSLTNNSGGNVISGYTYSYYLDGNQAKKVENTGKTTSYAYDGLGRLISEAESGVVDAITKTYSYDTSGNRGTLTVSGAESYLTTYAYDPNNRLITEMTDHGTYESTNSYNYDPNGNQLGKFETRIGEPEGDLEGLEVYQTGVPGENETYQVEINEYDTFNRLIKAITNTATAEYTYKADGLRYSKTVDDQTTIHVWDGGNIVLEADAGGSTIDTYIRGINLIKSATNGYYVYNAHGDVVELTDSSGNVTKNYEYDAFGVEKNPQEDDTNPFRYAGEYFDRETGDYYLRTRYYKPSIGRFMAEDTHWTIKNMIYGDDPLQLNAYTYMPDIDAIIQSGNLYSYCTNNPLTFVDPWGMYKYGEELKLGKGWMARIDKATESVKKHVHVYKNGETYAQNDDGSGHDKGDNLPGPPPKKVLKALKEKTGWDWTQKIEHYVNGAEIDIAIDEITMWKATYLDGKVYYEYFDALFASSYPTTSDLVNGYYNSVAPLSKTNKNKWDASQVYVTIPIIVPTVIPTVPNFVPILQ